MATTNAGAFTLQRLDTSIGSDGSMTVALQYINASSGAVVVTRRIFVPAAQANAITDQLGNVIAATVPTALANAVTTFLTQLDSTISTGATGNKLNL